MEFIKKGAVKMVATDGNGSETITCFKFESQFVTLYDSFMNGTPSENSIQAIEPCDLLLISYSDFK
uniref:Crp/Fnr family transcriptional regulator n=1 Tax=uncultured Tenacibaculum sp. TaxID=174713 RepID=UPI00262B4C0A|nr:cyclic nucleotide-binding domain-containing protein [uncultured Tenacibaculum sp.]